MLAAAGLAGANSAAYAGTDGGSGTDPTSVQPVAGQVQPSDNPVADPKAVVTIGNARFTVLTPQLIRMEWSADGKFEDHASLVFINRRLPVPKFEAVATTVLRMAAR